MKNMKRFFAVVLAVVMVFSTVAAASAASFSDVTETTEYKAAIDQLSALKVIEGYEDGTFKPEGEITRAEMVKMIYVMCVGTDAEGKVKAPTLFVGESVFTDVTTDHWACGYINWAASVGIVDGIGNKLFNPDAPVKFSEVVKMAILGGTVATSGSIPTTATLPSYPYGYISLADANGLFAGVNVKGASQPALRGETAQLLSNIIAAAQLSAKFQHLTALENVYFLGSTDEKIWQVPTAAADGNKWDSNKRSEKYICLGEDLETITDANSHWYRYDTPEDLVYGEKLTAYVDNNGQVALITVAADATVLETTVEGLTTSGSGNNLKYLVNGKEVKFDGVKFYQQQASGWYTVNANGAADYTSINTDAPVRLIDTDGDGKYEIVLVSIKVHNAKITNSATSGRFDLGTVTALKAGNILGATAADAVKAGTYFSYTLKRDFQASVQYFVEPMVGVSNVKVEKLDGLSAGEYTKVTIGGKVYTYASNFTGTKIEKVSTVTTDNKAQDTVDVRLDANGKIVGWNYYVAPSTTPAPVTGADKTAYAFVKSIFAEEVVGTYTRVTQYTITVVDLDGTEASYVLDDSVITANPSAWFAGTGNANNKISVETRNGELVPVINGKLVEYTADTFKDAQQTTAASNKVTALAAYANDVTGATVVYDDDFTGLINIAGDYKLVADIAAVLYDGKVMPVADFIALLGESKTFTANYSLDNGKYTLEVAKFAAATVPVVTNKVYAIITNTSVVAGSDKDHWKYELKGTFNGVAGTYESIDCDAAADLTVPAGLTVAVLKDGKVAGFELLPNVQYKAVSAKYGDLWMTHNVDFTNKVVDPTEVPVDMGAARYNSITVYKIGTKNAGVNAAAASMSVGSLSDIQLTKVTEDPKKTAKVYAIAEEDAGNGKFNATIFVLTVGTGDSDPSYTLGTYTPSAPVTITPVDPVAGTAYKLAFVQGNVNKLLYLTGEMNGYYAATTEVEGEGVEFTLEATTGGFYLSADVRGVKKYVNFVEDGNYKNVKFEKNPTTVFTIEDQTIVGVIGGQKYVLGTKNTGTYETLGPMLKGDLPFTAYFVVSSGVVPAPIPAQEVSIPDFNTAASAVSGNNVLTDSQYMIEGKITSIVNTTYGNMYIEDANGNQAYIYGLLQNGTSYGQMAVKPEVGDTIKVSGYGTVYNSNPQMKNAELVLHTPLIPAGAQLHYVVAAYDHNVRNSGYAGIVTAANKINVSPVGTAVAKGSNGGTEMTIASGATVDVTKGGVYYFETNPAGEITAAHPIKSTVSLLGNDFSLSGTTVSYGTSSTLTMDASHVVYCSAIANAGRIYGTDITVANIAARNEDDLVVFYDTDKDGDCDYVYVDLTYSVIVTSVVEDTDGAYITVKGGVGSTGSTGWFGVATNKFRLALPAGMTASDIAVGDVLNFRSRIDSTLNSLTNKYSAGGGVVVFDVIGKATTLTAAVTDANVSGDWKTITFKANGNDYKWSTGINTGSGNGGEGTTGVAYAGRKEFADGNWTMYFDEAGHVVYATPFTGTLPTVPAAPVVLDFTAQGYTNQQEVTSLASGAVTVTLDKGSNSNTPKFYDTGSAVRVYAGSTVTIAASSGNITKIEVTFGSSDKDNTISADVGAYADGTWTGSASSVTLTVDGASGHRRFASITVTLG